MEERKDRSLRISRRRFLQVAGATGVVGSGVFANVVQALAQGRLSEGTLKDVAKTMAGIDLSQERIRGWNALLQDVVFPAAARVREPSLFEVEPVITFSARGEER